MKYGVIPTNPLERLALALGKIPVPVLDGVFSLLKARAIMAGVRLGIFEAMRDGDRSAAELSRKLGLDEDSLDMLLRALVLVDYLDQRGDRYVLSKVSRKSMVSGGAMELRGFMEWNYTQWDFVAHLEELLRSGRGVDFHESLKDREAWGHYQRAMLELARLDAPVVASRVPVPRGATRLLDVAGSHGLLGAAVCRKHPPLRSTVVDLPQALEHARPLALAEGVGDLVEHRAADLIHDELGSDYDVALLANILHHFLPQETEDVLKKVRRALRGKGTVAIWEIERPRKGSKVKDGDGVALFFRLTSTAGAYHGSEYAEWLRSSGFDAVRIERPLLSPGNVLVTGVAG